MKSSLWSTWSNTPAYVRCNTYIDLNINIYGKPNHVDFNTSIETHPLWTKMHQVYGLCLDERVGKCLGGNVPFIEILLLTCNLWNTFVVYFSKAPVNFNLVWQLVLLKPLARLVLSPPLFLMSWSPPISKPTVPVLVLHLLVPKTGTYRRPWICSPLSLVLLVQR